MRRASPKLAVTTALPCSIGEKSVWSGHGKEVVERDVGGGGLREGGKKNLPKNILSN